MKQEVAVFGEREERIVRGAGGIERVDSQWESRGTCTAGAAGARARLSLCRHASLALCSCVLHSSTPCVHRVHSDGFRKVAQLEQMRQLASALRCSPRNQRETRTQGG